MPAANAAQPNATKPWFQPGSLALAIETSNPSAVRGAQTQHNTLGVCIARCEQVNSITHPPSWTLLHTEPLRTDNPQHDDLASCIDRCARVANITPRHINAICVSLGPGGFTSVRVAVVTAKMICEATGAACLGIPSAEVVMHAMKHVAQAACAEHQATTAVALASKGDNTYITLFDKNNNPIRPGFLCDAEKLRSLHERDHARTLIADQFLPQAMRERAAALGLTILEPTYSPLACIQAAVRHHPIEPAHLLPLYPREPEAVTKWRLLHGA